MTTADMDSQVMAMANGFKTPVSEGCVHITLGGGEAEEPEIPATSFEDRALPEEEKKFKAPADYMSILKRVTLAIGVPAAFSMFIFGGVLTGNVVGPGFGYPASMVSGAIAIFAAGFMVAKEMRR